MLRHRQTDAHTDRLKTSNTLFLKSYKRSVALSSSKLLPNCFDIEICCYFKSLKRVGCNINSYYESWKAISRRRGGGLLKGLSCIYGALTACPSLYNCKHCRRRGAQWRARWEIFFRGWLVMKVSLYGVLRWGQFADTC